jgi:DNA polymerase-3 subunit delta'
VARIIDQILGHKDIIERMLKSFDNGKPGQTYLFVGPSGIGKRMSALGFAQALLCSESLRACGRCGSCLRMEKGTHEGLKVVIPNGANIVVSQAREIIDFLNLKSLSGRRVIIIDQAQLLNPMAANSLLKTLEEPPEGTFFFLIAPSIAGLLPTIRSRSRAVHFRPLQERDLAQRSQAPQWAIRSARGSFQKLSQLLDRGEQELRGKSVEILKLFIRDPHFLLNENWRSEVKDRSQALEIMSYWVSFLSDAICFQENAQDRVVNLDQTELVKELAGFGRSFLLGMAEDALKAEQALTAHRDPQLVIEEYYILHRPA